MFNIFRKNQKTPLEELKEALATYEKIMEAGSLKGNLESKN